MKILFIGDIVGKSGRLAVKQELPALKEKYNPDFIIANGENAAHGKGITEKIFHELLSYGIDCVTMGNHAYAKSNIVEIMNDKRLVTPVNYLSEFSGGNAIRYFEVMGQKIGVINVIGKVFMDREVSDPITTVNKLLKDDCLYICDFHGEATGEKAIFARYFKDKMLAVLGTHTHVQTCDNRLFDGCAFISDVGMCGAYESVLGRDIEEVTKKNLNEQVTRYTIAEGPYEFNAVLITVHNGKANSIERIRILP